MSDSEKLHWEKFWSRSRNIKDVYPTSRCLIDNLRLVTDFNYKKVLEIGAGSGRDSLNIRITGGDVYVLDYAKSSLKTIRELLIEEGISLKLIMGDALSLPFSDSSFDIVFHQGLLEHFRNPEEILKENVRILKEGGFLLVDVPQRFHLYTVLKHILIFFRKWFAGWETEYSIRKLERLIKSEGLKIVSVYGDWMNPSLFYRILREIFLKFGIKFPLYPGGICFIRRIRKKIKDKIKNNRLSFYTFNNIGVIGRK